MTAEVLSQLKVLRGGLAETVQGDPRYLTLNALDKSVIEIAAVAGASAGDASAIPTQVLGQLKTIRDGIADGLRNDHRYLTLNALDKSIAEIGSMLAANGLIAPEHAAPMPPVHFEPAAPAASGAASPAMAPVAPPAPTMTPAPPAAPAPQRSDLKPLLETAAVAGAGAGAGGLAAEAPASEVKPSPMAKAKPKPAAPVEEPEDEQPEDEQAEGEKAEDAEGTVDEAEGDEAEGEKAQDEEPTSDEPEDKAAGDEAEGDEAEDKDEADETGDETGDEADETEDEKPDDEEAKGEKPEDHGALDDGAENHGAEDDEAAGDVADADAAAHDGEQEDTSKDEGTKDAADAATADPAGIVPPGKASGYVPMAAKPGAAQYQPGLSVKFGKLPKKVDLRPLMTPIEDQGNTSSCVANAVAGAYEYWIKKASKQDTNISRLFVYYNARWRDGSQDKDEGSVIQLAMEGLSKFGACPEHVWPFDPRLVLKKPGGEAYKDAAPYRVQDMAQVPLKLDAWKQAIAEGKPIVFGCALFDSFDDCVKRGGVVPMPSPDDVARAKHSGHSMCAVGYSDAEKVFIVRNSWGADWADKGYCYMPYDYLMNPKFNDGDCWVFVPKVPMQPPREVWSDTTEPVTNGGQGVDFPISTFTVADYENIAIDLFEHVRKPFNATVLEDYGQYVSLASRSLWSEFESFDFATFLTSTMALTGVTSLATEFLSEISETETTETSESSEDAEASNEESDETDAADGDESDDDESDDAEDETSEDDDPEDDDDAEGGEESDDADEADSDDPEADDASDTDEADDGDEDSDDEDSDDKDSDDEDSEGEDSEGEESEGEESEGEEFEGEDSEGDGDAESEDDAEDDADDTDSDEDSDDDGDDEGGDDDGGGDEGGDDEGGDDE